MTLEETEQYYLQSIHTKNMVVDIKLNPIEKMLHLGILLLLKDVKWIEVFPQSQIEEYTVDFLIAGRNPINGIRRRLVVEVDGHDFHEKTKEQAQRDKQRDRFLTSQGYEILRFTGSEVYKDPFECGEEIYGFIVEENDAKNPNN